MAGGRHQGGGDEQDLDFLLWGSLVAIAALGFFLWYMKEDLIAAWQAFMLPQAAAVSAFAKTEIGQKLVRMMGDEPQAVHQVYHWLATTSPSQIPVEHVKSVSHFLARYVNFVLVPLLALLAIAAYRMTGEGASPHSKRLHNYRDMFHYAKQGIPFLRDWKLIEGDVDLYDSSHPAPQTPWRFAMQHKLWSKDTRTLDEEGAARVFIGQLGRRFTTFEDLCQTDLKWVVDILLERIPRKHHKDVIAYSTRGHLYDYTVIIAMLFAARRFGVVECIWFNRLLFSSKHRPLFFAISSAGRKVAFVEGAGITAQYEYEMAIQGLKMASVKPVAERVQGAVEALAEALEHDPEEFPWEADSIWNEFDPTA